MIQPTTSQAHPTLPPGPESSAVAGNIPKVVRFVSDPVGYAHQNFRTYGPIFTLAHGKGASVYSPRSDTNLVVCAYGPDYVQTATTQHEIFYKYPLSAKIHPLGETKGREEVLKNFLTGLFGVNGDEHRQHRRLLMPAFHKKRIEAYAEDMVAITEDEINQWQPGATIDVAEEMQHLTMRIATKTLFGEDIGEGGRGIGQIIAQAAVNSPLRSLLPYDLPGLPYRRYLDLAEEYNDAMLAMIAQKRSTDADDGTVLSMLLEARDADTGAVLTEDELLGHAGVIFAAGHETSSNALTWTLFLLSQYPAVANALLDELDGVLHGSAPTIEQLEQLPLLEHVVKESMRVLPPVPWNARVVSQPVELGGYDLPTGSEVWISIYETHHMPELYPDPYRFDPYRWETIQPSAFEYNPFSAGPRMCIGATFAMLEIRLVLALLLPRFRLEFVPDQKIDRVSIVVMRPKQGIRMAVRSQDRRYAGHEGGALGQVREMVALP